MEQQPAAYVALAAVLLCDLLPAHNYTNNFANSCSGQAKWPGKHAPMPPDLRMGVDQLVAVIGYWVGLVGERITSASALTWMVGPNCLSGLNLLRLVKPVTGWP
jgi:hypothetical protein